MKYLELTNLKSYQKELVKIDDKDLSVVFLVTKTIISIFGFSTLRFFRKFPTISVWMA